MQGNLKLKRGPMIRMCVYSLCHGWTQPTRYEEDGEEEEEEEAWLLWLQQSWRVRIRTKITGRHELASTEQILPMLQPHHHSLAAQRRPLKYSTCSHFVRFLQYRFSQQASPAYIKKTTHRPPSQCPERGAVRCVALKHDSKQE